MDALTTAGSMDDGPNSDSPEDGPTLDASGDASGCATLAKKDCTTCCQTSFKAGHHLHVVAELACACAMPSLCGSVEGGTKDAATSADASALGEGACKAACGAKMAAPTAECTHCLREAAGNKAMPGACFDSVQTACKLQPRCVDYVTCINGCP